MEPTYHAKIHMIDGSKLPFKISEPQRQMLADSLGDEAKVWTVDVGGLEYQIPFRSILFVTFEVSTPGSANVR